MHKAVTKLRRSKIDQENLSMKIKDWERQYPEDNIFFRGYGQTEEEDESTENEDNLDGNIKVRKNYI